MPQGTPAEIRPSLTPAFGPEGEASGASPAWGARCCVGRAARAQVDRRSSTKAAVSAPRGDPPVAAGLDEWKQRDLGRRHCFAKAKRRPRAPFDESPRATAESQLQDGVGRRVQLQIQNVTYSQALTLLPRRSRGRADRQLPVQLGPGAGPARPVLGPLRTARGPGPHAHPVQPAGERPRRCGVLPHREAGRSAAPRPRALAPIGAGEQARVPSRFPTAPEDDLDPDSRTPEIRVEAANSGRWS